MTINAPASILLLLYQLVAEENGIPGDALTGTIQNDVLKEYIARGTYIYPPKESLRHISDIFGYCATTVPRWNTISISGYHMAEAGATPAQEVAFTLANAKEYVRAAQAAGEIHQSAVLGRPTVSLGTIRGGTATNVVPDRCEIQVDRRLMPGETAAAVLADLRARLADVPGGIEIRLLKEGLPFHTPAEAGLVRRFSAALAAAGIAPVLEGAAWCSDAGPLAPVCGETLVWGPGSIAQAHTVDEYIEAAALESGRDVLRRFLLDAARAG